MANIQIADLAKVEIQFDELSDLEVENVVGGRKVTKIDTDGDGRWDIKIVERVGKITIRYR
jgi:Zn-dependent membrane protease YugP